MHKGTTFVRLAASYLWNRQRNIAWEVFSHCIQVPVNAGIQNARNITNFVVAIVIAVHMFSKTCVEYDLCMRVCVPVCNKGKKSEEK